MLPFQNLPRCLKQQKLNIHIPKCCLSKSSKMPQTAKAQNLHPKLCLSKSSKMPQTAKAQNLHPRMSPFQIFQDASNSKAQNLHPKMLPFQILQDASNSKSSKPTSQNVAFPNLPRHLKQQKLKTYIPKWCLSKSSKMPQTAKAQNPTSQNVAFSNLPTCQKKQKLKTYIPKCCLSKSCKMPQPAKSETLHPKLLPFQIFQHAKKSKSLNLHPKMMPFQISQDASNSKSSKPTSQNNAFPNLQRCLKQQKLKTYIPKCCLSKSSKMPQTAKLKTYIPNCCLSKSSNTPQTVTSQNLHPKMLPSQIFQDASTSKSSKPTSQNVAFPNLPRCLERQKLKTIIPKYCLSKSSMMPQTATAQNLHPKMLPSQIFQHASTSKSSKPTSQNVAFPNQSKCQKQQKLKTYIPKCSFQIFQDASYSKAQHLHPKMLPSQIFQDASNSNSSKPTSQNVAFPNLPRCLKQQQLKTYIPQCCLSKASNISKVQRKKQQTLKAYISKCCLSKSSNMPKKQKLKTNMPKTYLSKSSKIGKVPKTARAQNLHPKMLPFQSFQHWQSPKKSSKGSTPTSQNGAFPNLPTCQKAGKAHNLHPKMLPFPNLPRCLKQQKLKTDISK